MKEKAVDDLERKIEEVLHKIVLGGEGGIPWKGIAQIQSEVIQKAMLALEVSRQEAEKLKEKIEILKGE